MNRIYRYPFGATILVVVGLLIGVVRPAGAADESGARAFIDDLGRNAIEVLERPGLTQDQATNEFGALFREGFDIPTIGRFVLGRYWRQASEAQRQEYLNLFETMVVETYARRFRQYSGETLQVNGSRLAGEQDILVDSRIVRPGSAPPVSVVWRVRDRGGSFDIIDVMIEGVSMSVTQRNEFGAIIQRNGGSIDALLDAMEANIESARRGA